MSGQTLRRRSGVLKGLKGVARAEVDAIYAATLKELKAILLAGHGAIGVGDNCSFHAYRDDSGKYIGENFRYGEVIDSIETRGFMHLKRWWVLQRIRKEATCTDSR